MRRLEELLRQMCQAAKAIGNTELENKFALGMTLFRSFYYKKTPFRKLEIFQALEYTESQYLFVQVQSSCERI